VISRGPIKHSGGVPQVAALNLKRLEPLGQNKRGIGWAQERLVRFLSGCQADIRISSPRACYIVVFFSSIHVWPILLYVRRTRSYHHRSRMLEASMKDSVKTEIDNGWRRWWDFFFRSDHPIKFTISFIDRERLAPIPPLYTTSGG
jgi:hypothetical protein